MPVSCPQVSFNARRLRWERPQTAAEGGGLIRHSVKVDAFPIGIDPQRFRQALASDAVQARVKQLQQQFQGVSVILGVDRVDYIKGMKTPIVPCGPCSCCDHPVPCRKQPAFVVQASHKNY